ncbi:MAG: 2-phospho-L-lactate transferase [Candidatus Bathyarchaeia archaeon]
MGWGVSITVLAGGVGAAKLLTGLVKLVGQEDITVIVNTGDDIELHGLHISPDIDIITYTLAGIVDEEKGWGVKDDTFQCLEALGRLGCETWFRLGDMDLATHIYRTSLLRRGSTLSQATAEISKALGVKVRILPMSDDKVETWIHTKDGLIHFQEYLVKRGMKDEVLGLELKGVEDAEPAPSVLDSILDSDGIIIPPSNPIVSIGTILSIKGVREALRSSKARRVAISPLIAGRAVKGPLEKLLSGLGLESSAYAIAEIYRDLIDTFILDKADIHEKPRIERLGLKVVTANTLMVNLEDKVQLADIALKEAQRREKL